MFFITSKLNFIILFTIACTTYLFPQKISLDSLIQIHQNKPQDKKILIEIGELYAAEKKWHLAIDFYEKLVDLDPDNPDYLYRLGGTQAAYSEVVTSLRYCH